MKETDKLADANLALQQEIAERKKTENALRESNSALKMLNNASRALNSILNPEQVLKTVLEEVRHLMDVIGTTIWLIDEKTNELVCREATGPSRDQVCGIRLSPGQGLVGWVAMHRESLLVPNTQTDARHSKFIDKMTGLELNSILSVPIRSKDLVIGVLQVVDNEPNRFSQQDVPLFETLASSAGIAIENARLYEQAQKEIEFRKQAEEALRESEEKYRSILESIEEGYFEIDTSGVFVFYNDSLCRILGYPGVEIYGKDIREYIDEKSAESIPEIMERIFHTELPVKTFEMELTRKNGSRSFVETSLSLIKGRNNEKIGFRGVVRDITERKNLESQLAQAHKLESIGQLAAGIAHEINTPMQYIGDNLHFLNDSYREIDRLLDMYDTAYSAAGSDGLSPEWKVSLDRLKINADIGFLREEIPEAIRQSLDGIERVANIVRAMKEFSHPGGMERIPTDINRAIENTIEVTRNEWKYVAEILTDFDSGLPVIPCHPGEFNQAILNMIVNAAHAISDVIDESSGEKGVISISTRDVGENAEIRISDTGSGIPLKFRPRIFDLFFTTKEVGKGTGQGLYICHSVIVQKHNGSIDFKSEPGRGTTFIVRLPKH